MFTRPHASSELDNEISRLISELDLHKVNSDEYKAAVSQLETLHKLRATDRPDFLKLDTMATVAANLVGIWLLLRYEKTGKTEIISSKALGFVPKIR